MFRRVLVSIALISLIFSTVSCGVGPFGQSPTATPTKTARAKATKTPTPSSKTKVKATPTLENEVSSAPAEDESATVEPGNEPTAPSEEEVTPTPPKEPQPTATSEEAQPPQGIGQTQESGDYRVTINSVRRESNGNEKPAAGNEFIIVNATVENTSSHDLPVSGVLMFELSSGDGTVLDHTDSAKMDKELEGLVGSGEKLTGDTAWEAPKGASGLSLSFETPLGGSKITFNLGQ